MNKFTWIKVFNSPFVTPKIRFYCGKLNYGVPYFFPRRWVKNKEKYCIIMRGTPGTGKSFTAKEMLKKYGGGDPHGHIFSTDDFFVRDVREERRLKQDKMDLIKVIILNAVYLAVLLGLYYANKGSHVVDNFFAKILHF